MLEKSLPPIKYREASLVTTEKSFGGDLALLSEKIFDKGRAGHLVKHSRCATLWAEPRNQTL